MTLPTIQTERLVLRPFEMKDAPGLERLVGMREVADTTLNIPHPYPAGGGAKWIAPLEAQWEKGERLTLAVCPRSHGSLSGAIALVITQPHEHAEVGYWIAPSEWGKGYATEAVRAMLDYGFRELKLHRIQGRHFGRNPASGRVMEKAGMVMEGVHREAYKRWGKFEDSVVYAKIADQT